MPARAPVALSPYEEQLLAELESDLFAAEPLHSFIGRVNPRFPPPRHLGPLIRLMERTRFESVFACVSMPPRHRKTTTIGNGIAWSLALDPTLQNVYVGHALTPAKKKSKIIRSIAARAGVRMDPRRQGAQDWGVLVEDRAGNLEPGGGLMATSIGGPFTGEGVTGILMVDDPIKNRKDAESETVREDQWDWFTNVAMSRMEPGSSCIVVMHRWHDDDLIGRLLSERWTEIAADLARDQGIEIPAWESVIMTALCEDETDGTGRALGEPLWPEKYGRGYLEMRRQLNPWAFASLYQQQPRPKHGRLFGSPSRFRIEDFLAARGADGYRISIGVDCASTEDTRNDPWAAVVMLSTGTGPDLRGWIVDVWNERVDVPTGAERLLDIQKRWGGSLFVEGNGPGKATISMLRRLPGGSELDIVEVIADRDKYTRAQPVAAAWNRGACQVALGAAWADGLIKEAQKFTGSKGGRDDQIDALAHVWNGVCDMPDIEEWDSPLSHMPGEFGSLG